MSTQTQRPVIVGIDDRPTSRDALDWGMDEATRRTLPLHILHALEYPPGSRVGTPGGGDHTTPAVVADAVAHVHTVAPWLHITTEVSHMHPSLALLETSERAACIVVGARGRGTLMSALLGTTSLDVAAHARCPVVVVRQFPEMEMDPMRPGVLVGADGSEVSAAAIGYAFAQAAIRDLPLTVVHVWSPELRGTDPATALSALTEEEQALAAAEVAGWTERYPDVKVHRQVLHGHPVKLLVDKSHGAELLVVGSRGRGGFAGMLLGSVSQGVLHHAHCPVAIVRSASP